MRALASEDLAQITAMRELCEHSQRICAEARAAQQQAQATRRETRSLIERARLVRADAAWAHLDETPAPTALTVEEGRLLTPQLEQPSFGRDTRQAARRIGAILREFPLEQQVIIVKALVARTMVLVRDHVHPEAGTTMAA